MFDLELAIVAWRKQMLTAGIKAPVPLEELESHLREEIELQMKLGQDEREAFNSAVQKIGQVSLLKTEFKKISRFTSWLGENIISRVNRVLGVLWLVGCSFSFITICQMFHPFHLAGATPSTALVIFNGLILFIYATGILGSIFLIRGAKLGQSVIRMIALLMAIACVAQISCFRMLPVTWCVWCSIVAIFSFVSIWLLNSTKQTNSKTVK